MKKKLIHGDCLEEMKSIKDAFVDLVLADPPYGTTACKWDSIIPLEPLWEQLKRIIKPNGVIVMTAAQPFTTALISSNMEWFKYCWYWKKPIPTGFLNCQNAPLKNIEDVCVFSPGASSTSNKSDDNKNRMNYYPVGVKKTSIAARRIETKRKDRAYKAVPQKEYQRTLENFPRALITFNVESNRVHPTQKPVSLMEYLIETYTRENDVVLDFCMGSGTTGIGCVNLNRNFIGIEKDEEYFKIAKERINNTIEKQKNNFFKKKDVRSRDFLRKKWEA